MTNTPLVHDTVANVSSTSNSVTQTQDIATQSIESNNHLQLVAWKVSWELWQANVYRELLQHLLQIPKDRVQYLITNRPGRFSLPGVLNQNSIPLQVT